MYALQHGSLFVTSFVFLMGLLFKVNGVTAQSPVYSGLSAVMLTMTGTFIAVYIGLVAVMICRNLLRAHPNSKLLPRGSSVRRFVLQYGNDSDDDIASPVLPDSEPLTTLTRNTSAPPGATGTSRVNDSTTSSSTCHSLTTDSADPATSKRLDSLPVPVASPSRPRKAQVGLGPQMELEMASSSTFQVLNPILKPLARISQHATGTTRIQSDWERLDSCQRASASDSDQLASSSTSKSRAGPPGLRTRSALE